MLSFARELGLTGPVAEALFSLPRPAADLDESAYAQELREAFRKIEGNTAENAQAFRLFANSLSEGWPKKAAAERFGSRLLAARDFEGHELLQSDLARAHIEANLHMLEDIGEHHLYEPWKWNEYIDAAYHDLGTFDYITNAVVMAIMGSNAVSMERLAQRLNRMAMEVTVEGGIKASTTIRKRCLDMGNALRNGTNPALLNALLDIWTLIVEAKTDVFGKFEREKPRSGFFNSVSESPGNDACPVDLQSIARRTIPDFIEYGSTSTAPCSVLEQGAAFMTGAAAIGGDSIVAISALDGSGATIPCSHFSFMTCSGFATFAI